MVSFHRTLATWFMSVGGLLFLAGLAIPYFLRPEIPDGFRLAALVLLWASLPVFVVGACLFARGNGYPFWIGIFSVTVIGLLILMLLPDRCPERERMRS
jgi:hypothetical protein